jgi:hypothetical protein
LNRRRPGFGPRAGLTVLLLIAAAAMRPALAQQTCTGDSYLPASSFSGGIVIAEQAVTYAQLDCPVANQRLGKPIRLRPGQKLFFWFRVQGDEGYLATAQSWQPFFLKLYRYNGSDYVGQDAVSMDRLVHAAAVTEARGNAGIFDWRLGAWKTRFDVPGTYRIVVTQDGADLGCAGSSTAAACDAVIEVVP